MPVEPPRLPKFSRRSFLGLGGAGAVAGLGYGFLVEPARISVERIRLRLPGLGSALESFRIVLLSDFHLHPFTKLPLVRAAVEAANALKPDLVLLLGDFVDETADAIHELAPELARLNARLGVFGVLGNHDHWKGAGIVGEGLRAHGIPLLINHGVELTVGTAPLFLAGIDSAWAGRPALGEALRDLGPGVPCILMAHEPDFADAAAQDGRTTLQVSGHSHGGQVRLPGIGALSLPSWGRKYDHGHYPLPGLQLYTNRGIGVVDIPVRFNCPPEVTEITLAS
jgi:predicted MPP superfamily phosphohydrolase